MRAAFFISPESAAVSNELDLIRWPVRLDETNVSPELPGWRFNASIIDWQGEYLLAYRNGWAGSEVHLIRLDRQFRPKGESVKLDLFHPEEANYGREDPRLFWHKRGMHVAYIGVAGHDHVHHTSVLFARLDQHLRVEDKWYCHFPGRNFWEKNWQFFDFEDELYAVYSVSPHRILRIECERATLVYETAGPANWTGSEIRGGASPVRVSDEFYCFFHSSVVDHAHGCRAYSTGLYTFEARPPFRVVAIVPEPILEPDHATKPPDKYESVVFACGAVLCNDRWIVSHGVHDRWVELHPFDKRRLDARLERVVG